MREEVEGEKTREGQLETQVISMSNQGVHDRRSSEEIFLSLPVSSGKNTVAPLD
jgi:hypothetical protein